MKTLKKFRKIFFYIILILMLFEPLYFGGGLFSNNFAAKKETRQIKNVLLSLANAFEHSDIKSVRKIIDPRVGMYIAYNQGAACYQVGHFSVRQKDNPFRNPPYEDYFKDGAHFIRKGLKIVGLNKKYTFRECEEGAKPWSSIYTKNVKEKFKKDLLGLVVYEQADYQKHLIKLGKSLPVYQFSVKDEYNLLDIFLTKYRGKIYISHFAFCTCDV